MGVIVNGAKGAVAALVMFAGACLAVPAMAAAVDDGTRESRELGAPVPLLAEYHVDARLSDDAVAGLQLAQDAADVDDVNDPLEEMNRAIFDFNELFYDVVLRPVSSAYNWLPMEIRNIVGGVLSNLSAPVIFANDVLQGEGERAFNTASRFVLNSTFGFAGMADFASSFGFEPHREDFGQTLAVWGVGEGPYLVLPILGPSNPRDAIGRFVVDSYLDPFSYYLDNVDKEEWQYARLGATAVVRFAEVKDDLDEVKRTSVDYYAAIRSLYRQRREAAIANGREVDLPPIPDMDFHGTSPSSESEMGGAPASDPDFGEGMAHRARGVNVASFGGNERNPFASRFTPVEGKALRHGPEAETKIVGAAAESIPSTDTQAASDNPFEPRFSPFERRETAQFGPYGRPPEKPSIVLAGQGKGSSVELAQDVPVQ